MSLLLGPDVEYVERVLKKCGNPIQVDIVEEFQKAFSEERTTRSGSGKIMPENDSSEWRVGYWQIM